MDQCPCHNMLSAIVRAICRRTESPSVEMDSVSNRWIVSVSGRDKGRAIGKSGKTVWAMDTLLWYAHFAHATRPARVQVVDPEKTTRPEAPSESPFKPNPSWDKAGLGRLLDVITTTCLKRKLPWVMEDLGDRAEVTIEVDKYLKTPLSDPPWEDAVAHIIYSAGMSDGADVKTIIKWT